MDEKILKSALDDLMRAYRTLSDAHREAKGGDEKALLAAYADRVDGIIDDLSVVNL